MLRKRKDHAQRIGGLPRTTSCGRSSTPPRGDLHPTVRIPSDLLPRAVHWTFGIAALGLSLGACRGVDTQLEPAPKGEVEGPADTDPVSSAGLSQSPWLVLEAVDGRGRRPFRPDAVLRSHVLSGRRPEIGSELHGEKGSAVWKEAEPSDSDPPVVRGRRATYAFAEFESPEAAVYLADLRGATELHIGEASYAGDPYRYGEGNVPVWLEAGSNPVFVTGIRGRFELRLEAPPAPVFLAPHGPLVPDIVRGGARELVVGVAVVNASTEWRTGLSIVAEGAPWHASASAPFELAPLSQTRVAVPLALRAEPGSDPTELDLVLRLQDADTGPLGSPRSVRVPVRSKHQLARYTFRSELDGSVQEFCVLPPPAGPAAETERLLLSLHGAGVHAWNQAASYAARPDTWHVAATNRRPFGFDWQDWGRRDAYEVLEHALRLSGVDRRHVVLGGHSMGGHGTWHLGANDPDGFAALAPSAGWRSFDTYGGRPEGTLRALWHAADRASDTEALVSNLAQVPTYILHSEGDQSVPVAEARAMEALLREAGAEPEVHYEPERGHWWDAHPEPGVDCLAWSGFYELFEGVEIATWESQTELDFLSVDPGVDSNHYWVRVERPVVYGQALRVRARLEPASNLVVLETTNVGALSLQPPGAAYASGWRVRFGSDGEELAVPAEPSRARFVRAEGGWKLAPERSPGAKTPARSGPLKRALERNFVFVVPTAGNAEEQEASLARARYDQGVWNYRARGGARLVTDERLLGAPERYAGCDVVLYGNADTNRAWNQVVPAGFPLRLERSAVSVGDERYLGAGLGALFCAPRADDASGMVAALGSTGELADRAGAIVALFISGVGFPDYVVYDADAVLGSGDEGVLAAGWFDGHWGLQEADRFQAAR